MGITPSKSGPVLFVATENPTWNLKEKLDNMGGWPDNLFFLSELDLMRDATELTSIIHGEGVVLVVLDTLNKTWRMARENDNAEGTAISVAWENVLRRTGAAGLVLHHSGRSRREGKPCDRSLAYLDRLKSALSVMVDASAKSPNSATPWRKGGFFSSVLGLRGVYLLGEHPRGYCVR